MAVYGRLKRKYPQQKQFSLSPTKHTKDSDPLVSSQTLFSFPNNSIDSFKTHSELESSQSLFDIPQPTSDYEDSFVDEQPSSPILKPQTSNQLTSLFKGFEDLEDLDNSSSSKRHKSASNRKPVKTTIFSKLSYLRSTEDDSSQTFEDEDKFVEISSSLFKLNSRLSELESKVKSQTDESILGTEELNTYSVMSIKNTPSRTYGATRSFKIESKALSEDEEEEDDENIERRLSMSEKVTEANLFDLPSSNKCKSLQELRVANENENSKLDFEMIVDQIEQEIKRKKNHFDILLIKLELFNKLKSDTNFEVYIKRNVKGKDTHFTQLLTDLISISREHTMINFQLISFFGLSDYNKLNIVSCLKKAIQLGDSSLEHYTLGNVKTSRKVLKDLIEDWIKLSGNISIHSICLEMISNTIDMAADQLSSNDKNFICEFLSTTITNPKLFSSAFHIIRNNILPDHKFSLEKIAPIIIDSFSNLEIDLHVNIVLECLILTICQSNVVGVQDSLFTVDIWNRLWELFGEKKVFDNDVKLTEIDQNRCLLVLGCLFHFITYDEAISTENLKQVFSTLKEINTAISILEELTLIQSQCLGYFGCIAYHFCKKHNNNFPTDKTIIKSLLEKYEASKFFSIENQTLNNEVHKILNLI